MLLIMLRIAYCVLRKDAFPDAARNTQYEALFEGQEAFEL